MAETLTQSLPTDSLSRLTKASQRPSFSEFENMDSPSWPADLDNITKELGRWHKENSKSRVDSLTCTLGAPNNGNPQPPLSPDEALDRSLFDINQSDASAKGDNTASPSRYHEENAMWSLFNTSSQGHANQQNSSASANWVHQYGQVTPPDDVTPNQTYTEDPLDSFQHESKGKKRGSAQGDVVEYADDEEQLNSMLYEDAIEGSDDEDSTPLRKSPRNRRSTTRGKKQKESDPKRQEFLARNRLAASKSRQKKKEWTSQLETRCRELQAERAHLSFFIANLKEEIILLKTDMLKHTSCDCTAIRNYLAQTATSLNHPPTSTASNSSTSQSPATSEPHLSKHQEQRRLSQPSTSLSATTQSKNRPLDIDGMDFQLDNEAQESSTLDAIRVDSGNAMLEVDPAILLKDNSRLEDAVEDESNLLDEDISRRRATRSTRRRKSAEEQEADEAMERFTWAEAD